MKEEYYYCNRCGKELVEPSGFINYADDEYIANSFIFNDIRVDLCENCSELMDKFLRGSKVEGLR